MQGLADEQSTLLSQGAKKKEDAATLLQDTGEIVGFLKELGDGEAAMPFHQYHSGMAECLRNLVAEFARPGESLLTNDRYPWQRGAPLDIVGHQFVLHESEGHRMAGVGMNDSLGGRL